MVRIKDDLVNDYEIEHKSALRKMAPECMVLLKYDGSFPIKEPGKIAVYGNGARNTIKGGTGSGDVNVRSFQSVEETLIAEGFEITTTDWLDAYDMIREEAYRKFVEQVKKEAKKNDIPAFFAAMGAVMPEPEYDLLVPDKGELAVYVLSRISGEGGDRRDDKGDYRLTDTEIRTICTLQKNYQKFLLVLNVGGPLDLRGIEEVRNILLLSQLGMVTAEAFVDVLLGKANPSGKLTATWSAISDFSQIKEFGRHDDTEYTEKLFTGYRYFEKHNIDVQFPFGYGLSYTGFEIKSCDFSMANGILHMEVAVKNTGKYPGKEIVQIYGGCDHWGDERPERILLGFAKTGQIKPQNQNLLVIDIPMKRLAIYSKEGWLLSEGDYKIEIGTSLQDAKECGHFHLKSDKKIIEYKADDIIRKPNDRISKMTDEELVKICVGKYGTKAAGVSSIIGNAGSTVAGAAGETGDGALVMADGPAGLRISSKYRLTEQGAVGQGLGSMDMYLDYLEDEMKVAICAGKKQSDALFTKGNTYYQYCSAIPIGTALAQSWNEELVYNCGKIVAEEMQLFGVNLWLAPALNIQRFPLCGRNFEYYSEDPVVSGKIAAAMTKGVQSIQGCGVTLKHFACNNQETNRFHSNSIVEETTLREIYLQGFEIAVTEATPVAVMTSYNLLNGVHTCNRKDLITDILRNEWGFDGLVMTDWLVTGEGFFHNNKYPSGSAAGCIYAGNDLIMPGSRKDEEDILYALHEGDTNYPISRNDLEQCAYRVLRVTQELEDAALTNGREHT